jgi:hypothetical protein
MSLTSLLISPFLMVIEVQIDFAEKKFKLLAAKKYLTCKLLILYMKRVLINNWFPAEPRLYWHILDGWIFLDLLYQSRILPNPSTYPVTSSLSRTTTCLLTRRGFGLATCRCPRTIYTTRVRMIFS